MTRLEDPKKADLTKLQKLKLYNGKTLPTYNEDIKRVEERSYKRGVRGISPRYTRQSLECSCKKWT